MSITNTALGLHHPELVLVCRRISTSRVQSRWWRALLQSGATAVALCTHPHHFLRWSAESCGTTAERSHHTKSHTKPLESPSFAAPTQSTIWNWGLHSALRLTWWRCQKCSEQRAPNSSIREEGKLSMWSARTPIRSRLHPAAIRPNVFGCCKPEVKRRHRREGPWPLRRRRHEAREPRALFRGSCSSSLSLSLAALWRKAVW